LQSWPKTASRLVRPAMVHRGKPHDHW
jgi:hypothetical protein